MGCNCRKKSRPLGGVSTTTTTAAPGTGGQWMLRAAGFADRTFDSELEAEAARRRMGRGEVIPT